MLILDVDDRLAVHLTEAIRVHRKYLRESGRAAPSEYRDLEKTLATQGMRGSPEVTAGQSGSLVEPVAATAHGENVTAEALLTFEQAARRMRCSVSTVKRRVATGDLVPARHGRVVRLTVGDVDTYISHSKGLH